MKTTYCGQWLTLGVALAVASVLSAADLDAFEWTSASASTAAQPSAAVLPTVSNNAVPQSTFADGPGFPLLGQIKPRSAKEIVSSNWSIGGETLDRDFAVYSNYREYLGPLGAKAIRLQGGWCRTRCGIGSWLAG